jgi:hypothetical protein
MGKLGFMPFESMGLMSANGSLREAITTSHGLWTPSVRVSKLMLDHCVRLTNGRNVTE